MENDGEAYKVLTANRLADGVIVYARRQDSGLDWVTQIANATAFDETEFDDALTKAERFVTDCHVVGLYPVEVAGRNRPLSARETVRAKGPSIKYGHNAADADYSI